MLELAVVKSTPKSHEASNPHGKAPAVDRRSDDRQKEFQEAYDDNTPKTQNESDARPEREATKPQGAEKVPSAVDGAKKGAAADQVPDTAFAAVDEDALVAAAELQSSESGEDIGLGLGAKNTTANPSERSQAGASSVSPTRGTTVQAGITDPLATEASPGAQVSESADAKRTGAQNKIGAEVPVKSAAETVFLSNTVQSNGMLKVTDDVKPTLPVDQAVSQTSATELRAVTGKGSPDAVEVITSGHFSGIRKEQLAKAEERAPSRIGSPAEAQQAPLVVRAAGPAMEVQNTGMLQTALSSEGMKAKTDAMPVTITELEAIGAFEARTPGQVSTGALQQVLNRADTPTMIARQMAEALQRLPDRPVEIALNPRELGRVRMSISAVEAGITVNVIAERPETLDLMRRNIDQLAREFQSIGYEDINFAFAEGEAQQNFADDQESGPEQKSTHLDLTPIDEVQPSQQKENTSNGIDIRI